MNIFEEVYGYQRGHPMCDINYNMILSFKNSMDYDKILYKEMTRHVLGVWHKTDRYKLINRLNLKHHCEEIILCTLGTQSGDNLRNNHWKSIVEIEMTDEEYFLYSLLPNV